LKTRQECWKRFEDSPDKVLYFRHQKRYRRELGDMLFACGRSFGSSGWLLSYSNYPNAEPCISRFVNAFLSQSSARENRITEFAVVYRAASRYHCERSREEQYPSGISLGCKSISRYLRTVFNQRQWLSTSARFSLILSTSLRRVFI